MIYLAAVVPDKHDADHTPYVSTPVGPYQPDESDAIARGRDFLRAAYATEDIRRFDVTESWQDMDTARSSIQGTVAMETYNRRMGREARRAADALAGIREERWQPLGHTGYEVTAPEVGPVDQRIINADMPGITVAMVVPVELVEDLDAVLALLGVNPEDV